MKNPQTKPLTRQSLRGVWSALIVPWTKTDRLDERRWRREVRAYAFIGRPVRLHFVMSDADLYSFRFSTQE